MEALPHETGLIATIAVGLSAAFVGGLIAHHFRLPTLIGYWLAGVVLGHSPRASWPTRICATTRRDRRHLAHVWSGQPLLDRRSPRRASRPSAGSHRSSRFRHHPHFALTRFWGWDVGAGLVFGLALSVASTVVLLRVWSAGQLASDSGRVAFGWLLVEALITVVVLVLLPAIAPFLEPATTGLAGTPDLGALGVILIVTFAKVAAFIGLMLVGGVRVIP